MRHAIAAAFVAACCNTNAAPPAFPPAAVVEEFFGTRVEDPYRPLENVADPAVQRWMKAQAEHSERTLRSLPGFSALLARIAELDNAAEARIGIVRRTAAGDLFFTRRGVDDDAFKLFVRRADGSEAMLADPADWKKSTGQPHAINYFAPSRDGKLVAVGISAGGSEMATLYVIDTATRQVVGRPIDRARYANPSWLPDNRSFFYQRMQAMAPGMPATEVFKNRRAYLHRVGSEGEDLLVLGPGVTPRVPVDPVQGPLVIAPPNSSHVVALVSSGVQKELDIYTAPADTVGKPGTPWVRVAAQSDKVVGFAVHGETIHLLGFAKSPRFAVVATPLARPDLARAKVVVPPGDHVVAALAAARDGLYVELRDGALKRVKRLAWDGTTLEDVRLPYEGTAALMDVRGDLDGAIVGLSGWTRAREIFAVDARLGTRNTGLQPLGRFDAPAGLVATEVRVRSHDGVLVPLSIVHRGDLRLDGGNPAQLVGYGSYGLTSEATFSAIRLAWLERGGVYAVCNVRGGGVYGDEWHRAGYKATKPNTWKDLIACAEYLVQRGYTGSARLGIVGGSAGGITVGRAMTERPDLFASVVPIVGTLDMVRAEFQQNGVPNIPEFGTQKDADGFRGLLAMSAYHHVKPGVKYPAVLLQHGVNDSRVDVWQSSKMAARLQEASASGKPVLLDLEYESGHGQGATKAQVQRQAAHNYAFMLWHAGHPDFQPRP